MKHEIIYTDDYALIVSDGEIKDVRPTSIKKVILLDMYLKQ